MSERKALIVAFFGLLGLFTLLYWIRRGDLAEKFIQLDERYWECTDWRMRPIGMAVKRECVQWTFKP